MNRPRPASTVPKLPAWAALHAPGYPWLLTYSSISFLAGTTYMLGQGWLVLQLTNSPAMVGLAVGLGGGAHFLLSPLAGVLTDHLDRRRLLLATQLATAALNFALSLVLLLGEAHLWHLLLMSALLGACRGVTLPTRSALTYDLVGQRAILNAVTAQFTTLHIFGALGPLAGGLVLARWGATPFLLLVTITALLSALPLLCFKTPARARSSDARFVHSLRAGFDTVRRDRHLLSIVTLMLTTEGLGFAVTSMFPVMARDILGGDATLLGLMTALWSVGGLAASLALVTRGDVAYKGWLFVVAALLFGATLLAFSFSRSVPLSLMLLLCAGATGALYDIMVGTLFQVLAPDAIRGRVLAVQHALISFAQFGGFALGALAGVVGAPAAIAIATSFVTANAARYLPLASSLSLRSRAQ